MLCFPTLYFFSGALWEVQNGGSEEPSSLHGDQAGPQTTTSVAMTVAITHTWILK